jgi:hypothetical protein
VIIHIVLYWGDKSEETDDCYCDGELQEENGEHLQEQAVDPVDTTGHHSKHDQTDLPNERHSDDSLGEITTMLVNCVIATIAFCLKHFHYDIQWKTRILN